MHKYWVLPSKRKELCRGRAKTTTWNTKGRKWKMALFGGLERHYCHEKRSSKKTNCRLRGSFCSCTVIFDPENGGVGLQKKHWGGDIPWISITWLGPTPPAETRIGHPRNKVIILWMSPISLLTPEKTPLPVQYKLCGFLPNEQPDPLSEYAWLQSATTASLFPQSQMASNLRHNIAPTAFWKLFSFTNWSYIETMIFPFRPPA